MRRVAVVVTWGVAIASAGLWGCAGGVPKGRTVDARGAYDEERQVCGPVAVTPSRDAARCPSQGPTCEEKTTLEVEAPGPGWLFSDAPRLVCARGDETECRWNLVGAPGRFFVVEHSPTRVRVEVLTSDTVGLQLCATARRYSTPE